MTILNVIHKLPSIKEDRLDICIEFSDEAKNLAATIESFQKKYNLYNPTLVNELLSKMPTSFG